jgi:uncharacterized protein YaaW (UPF0174 family)
MQQKTKSCITCNQEKPLSDFESGHIYVNECCTCRLWHATGQHKPIPPPNSEGGTAELSLCDAGVVSFNDTLFQRLRLAKRPDLVALLIDLKEDPLKFRDDTDEDLVIAISAGLRSAAGNSIVNLGRDSHMLAYKQILIDVADKLAPGICWTEFKVSGAETEQQIEDYIHERVLILLAKHLESMDDADKAKLQKKLDADLRARGLPEQVVQGVLSGLAAGTLTGMLVGPIIASTLFGSLWTWLFGLSLRQLALGGLAGGGPAGLVISAAIIAAGPSYSKTIPAVVRLILIRLSYEAESKLGSTQ